MAENRVSLLRTAFARLEPSLAGLVSLDTLRVKYSAKSHPDVQSGKRTEEEVSPTPPHDSVCPVVVRYLD